MREHPRLDMTAERVRRLPPELALSGDAQAHACPSLLLILDSLARAIRLWQSNRATIRDVVLVCMLAGLTLSILVLSAMRDKGSIAGTKFAAKR